MEGGSAADIRHDARGRSDRTIGHDARFSRIKYIYSVIDERDPFDVAFFACLTTMFWATARLGEFMTPILGGFNAETHVKR